MPKQKTISNSNSMASPSHILGTTENATFAHFMKKSMHLKFGIFVRLSSLALASEWTTNRKKVCSLIDEFDRFITSEGSDTSTSVTFHAFHCFLLQMPLFEN